MKSRYIAVLAVLVALAVIFGLIIATDFALLLLFIDINNDFIPLPQEDRYPVDRPRTQLTQNDLNSCLGNPHGDLVGGGAGWFCGTEFYGQCVWTTGTSFATGVDVNLNDGMMRCER